MNLTQAREIVRLYGAALSKGKDGEIARKISLLPCNKDSIIKAHKLLIAYFVEFESLDQQTGETLIMALCGIGSFTEDKKAEDINKVPQMIKSGISGDDPRVRGFMDFSINAMYDGELFDEMNGFIGEVQALDKNDPLYHQRIYTLAGVEYTPEKKKSFWSSIFR